ncbi:MAG TPA: ClpXP protease specificity-enhancing factor SspB [Polyangia bacterium]|nr:ClpXP protease specificity-enhancing factor SspB [Polyangia bacterium]
MRSSERPSKHEVFLALLRESWTSLHLDARRPGVIVPAHLKSEPHLVLQYGHDLPIPIPDLEVDEHGVRATLSFSKHPQRTVVPWSAVYVVTCDDGRGVLYHEDVPEDVSIIATHPRADRSPADAAGEQMGDGPSVLADVSEGLPEELPEELIDDLADDQSHAEVESAANGASRRSAVPGTTGPSGRISERMLRSVPSDGAAVALSPPASGRRRRKPQLRLVK